MSRSVAAVALLAALVAVCLAADDKYSDRFDGTVNLDSILSDDQQLAQYRDCLVDAGDDKCNEQGKALKRILAEALQNDCAKCTDKQKSGAVKAIKFLNKNKPDIWQQLSGKFDPQGAFAKNHPDLFA
ncbi:hypothetical protein R5R35_002623 [Gryllus longicercus]|uniref:Chemosensory protein n=1 Tax=Gryllus longicercus TaxID=2509291 RepID=A0AAN9V7W5_9ORTH